MYAYTHTHTHAHTWAHTHTHTHTQRRADWAKHGYSQLTSMQSHPEHSLWQTDAKKSPWENSPLLHTQPKTDATILKHHQHNDGMKTLPLPSVLTSIATLALSDDSSWRRTWCTAPRSGVSKLREQLEVSTLLQLCIICWPVLSSTVNNCSSQDGRVQFEMSSVTAMAEVGTVNLFNFFN